MTNESLQQKENTSICCRPLLIKLWVYHATELLNRDWTLTYVSLICHQPAWTQTLKELSQGNGNQLKKVTSYSDDTKK